VLKLTEKAGGLLRGTASVELAMPRKVAPRVKKKRRRAAAVVADLDAADQALFASLRSVRLQLAQSENIPPYMVFGDKTLKQMALNKPDTPEAFLDLNGVGATKLDKYGDVFLAAVDAYCKNAGEE